MTGNDAISPLVQSGGYAIYEEDGRLLFANLGTGWMWNAGFVLALLVFIVGMNGIIFIGLGLAGVADVPPAWVGGVFLGIASVLALLLRSLFRVTRRVRPLDRRRVVAIVDIPGGRLLDGSERPLASLSEVRFGRALQLTSSAPSLAARWSGGRRIIAQGNFFAGGNAALEAVLRERGLWT